MTKEEFIEAINNEKIMYKDRRTKMPQWICHISPDVLYDWMKDKFGK